MKSLFLPFLLAVIAAIPVHTTRSSYPYPPLFVNTSPIFSKNDSFSVSYREKEETSTSKKQREYFLEERIAVENLKEIKDIPRCYFNYSKERQGFLFSYEETSAIIVLAQKALDMVSKQTNLSKEDSYNRFTIKIYFNHHFLFGTISKRYAVYFKDPWTTPGTHITTLITVKNYNTAVKNANNSPAWRYSSREKTLSFYE